MQILNLVQGSDEWKAIRRQYLVASEAPVIMGASPNMKRDELLHLKVTGLEREIDEWVEKFVFNRGHETEALARPIAEARLGDDLHAITGVNTVAGLPLLASYDGLIMPFHDNHWEHKQFNKELFELVKSGGELEGKHFWQLEHQLLVNGNDSCIFAVSDGTEENYAELVYESRPERREQLIEGWKVFLADMHSYVAPEAEPVKPAGEVIKDLPALVVKISGEVKSSNLATYKVNALDFIRNINTNLQTDQDFATAENVVKFCDRVEKELEVVKSQTLGQVSSIDEVVRTIDQLKDEMRSKRLQLEKLIKAEKENRKSEILLSVKQAWQAHIEACNKALGSVRLPDVPVDFAGAIKGKRMIETLRSAANDELARAKVEANRLVNHIDANLCLLREIASNHTFLFSDRQQLVLKDKDAVEAIARQRIAEHEAEKKAEIEAEAQRIANEKIAAEKAAEAKRLADEKAAEDKRIADEAATEAAEQKVDEPHAAQAPAEQDNIRTEAMPGSAFGKNPPLNQVVEREIPDSAVQSVARGGRSRPGDDMIVEVIASHYGVTKALAISWLRQVNLDAVERRCAA